MSTGGLVRRLERLERRAPSLDDFARAVNEASRRWHERGEIPGDDKVRKYLYRTLRFSLAVDLQMAGPSEADLKSMGPPEEGVFWSERQIEPFRVPIRARLAELDRAFGVEP